jgi:translation initiation factor RLI1
MASRAQRGCGVLAYGDLKRVELAVALANRPKLLLMDEPTAGIAPKERHDGAAPDLQRDIEQNVRAATCLSHCSLTNKYVSCNELPEPVPTPQETSYGIPSILLAVAMTLCQSTSQHSSIS